MPYKGGEMDWNEQGGGGSIVAVVFCAILKVMRRRWRRRRAGRDAIGGEYADGKIERKYAALSGKFSSHAGPVKEECATRVCPTATHFHL